jgi:hypothetical protein
VRRRAQLFYQQLDTLQALRQEVRRDLLAESRKLGDQGGVIVRHAGSVRSGKLRYSYRKRHAHIAFAP